MIRRPPKFIRTDTLFPYTTLFRSLRVCSISIRARACCRSAATRPRLAPWRLRLCLLQGSLRKASKRLNRRSEEHTSELQSLMRISYAVFCLKQITRDNYNRSEEHTSETQYLMRKMYAEL